MSRSNKPLIIVFQCGPTGRDMVQKALDPIAPRLPPGSIEYVSNAAYLMRAQHEYFDEARRQLFITGTVKGAAGLAAIIVRSLKDRNPELVCVGFSVDEIPARLDYHVSKGDIEPWIELGRAVEMFLSGELTRLDIPDHDPLLETSR